jgi:hypothetical protein
MNYVSHTPWEYISESMLEVAGRIIKLAPCSQGWGTLYRAFLTSPFHENKQLASWPRCFATAKRALQLRTESAFLSSLVT